MKPIYLIIALVFITVVVAGSGLFYWFEYRPTQAIKDCHSSAIEYAQAEYREYAESFGFGLDIAEARGEAKEKVNEGYYETEDYEPNYNTCLREKGLN